jgi:regulator of RNase E activity RraA
MNPEIHDKKQVLADTRLTKLASDATRESVLAVLSSLPATRESVLEAVGYLSAAVVSDVLDSAGLRNQVMDARVRPLFPNARVLGYAATVRLEATRTVPDERSEQYRLHLEAIERLSPGDVLVTSPTDVCFWGELMSIAAEQRGARGTVVDGYVRDVDRITELGFPTFCTGVSAADALGRSNVVELGGTVMCGGVEVSPGDVILGDTDGVVVIPAGSVSDVVIAGLSKTQGEDIVRAELRAGHSVSEVFQRYGIL